MKIRKIVSFVVCLVCAWSLSGCLSTEYKEYSFSINEDGSGTGNIKFINIVSEQDEGEDVVAEDFDSLINGYLNGQDFENENPNYNVTEKKLYEEEKQLVGEVSFTFDDIERIGFYRYKSLSSSPFMFYMGNITEIVESTNGEWEGAAKDFPIIVWEPGTTELNFRTKAQQDMSNTTPLLMHYLRWERHQ